MRKLNLSPTQACAAQHFGLWAVEPNWFFQAFAMIQAGTWQPQLFGGTMPDHADPAQTGSVIDGDGIAHMAISGQMTKGGSSFGGASTVALRHDIRAAVNDSRVKAMLLHIDSPGGTVAGTHALAMDVKAANGIKPVYAHVEDMAASAAYYVASQAKRITAEPTSDVGSIGTLAYVVDASGAFEKEGLKAYAVSSGPYKGAGATGTPVTPEHLAFIQDVVDDASKAFFAAVREGRGLNDDEMAAVTDGRYWDAAKAKKLGLVDAVASIDETMDMIRNDLRATDSRQRSRRAAVELQRQSLSL